MKSMNERDFSPVSLSAEGLTLSRGPHILVRELALQAKSGDAIQLTGRNGAGKTTLLRALAGFVQPDAGHVHLSSNAQPARPQDVLAWLGHADGIKPGETPRQALAFWARVYGVDPNRLRPALDHLGMYALIDRTAARMSRGQQRRCGLARIWMSERPVWLLDEPVGPLDQSGRDRLASLVSQHRARGGIVITATHQVLDWPNAQRIDLNALDGAKPVSIVDGVDG